MKSLIISIFVLCIATQLYSQPAFPRNINEDHLVLLIPRPGYDTTDFRPFHTYNYYTLAYRLHGKHVKYFTWKNAMTSMEDLNSELSNSFTDSNGRANNVCIIQFAGGIPIIDYLTIVRNALQPNHACWDVDLRTNSLQVYHWEHFNIEDKLRQDKPVTIDTVSTTAFTYSAYKYFFPNNSYNENAYNYASLDKIYYGKKNRILKLPEWDRVSMSQLTKELNEAITATQKDEIDVLVLNLGKGATLQTFFNLTTILAISLKMFHYDPRDGNYYLWVGNKE